MYFNVVCLGCMCIQELSSCVFGERLSIMNGSLIQYNDSLRDMDLSRVPTKSCNKLLVHNHLKSLCVLRGNVSNIKKQFLRTWLIKYATRYKYEHTEIDMDKRTV